MKNKLLIIGASGHGKVIADIALKMNKWHTIDFLDDDSSKTSVMGLNIIGKSADAPYYLDEYDMLVGVGNNTLRENLQKELEAKNATIPKLVHPTAVIAEQVLLKAGTVVMANAVVNCSSQIGKGCIINTGATIDHDNMIEDYVHISPGVNLGGTVTIGQKTWIGIGSTVINNLSITCESIIGAGAVVTQNITKTGTYVGVPARGINNGNNPNSSKQ